MKREEARVCINRWSARGCRIAQRGALGDRCDVDDPVSDPACVATLTTAYERRELQRRGRPYRGERLTPGSFAGVWEFEAGSVKPFAKETREFVVPGSEVVEDCVKCGARGGYRCDECDGEGRLQCWSCKGKPISRCQTCAGTGGSRCSWCDGRGSKTCPQCGGYGSTSYTDPDGYRPACSMCGGKGRAECNHCSGTGGSHCGNCGGQGICTCGTCGGQGVVNCRECKGCGTQTCVRCEGTKRYREWQALVVRFEVDKDSLSCGRSSVPADLLATAQGATLAATLDPAKASSNVVELMAMRDRLMLRHSRTPTPEGGARILHQRFEGKQVPVWKVPVRLRHVPHTRGDVWIFGIERQVWTGDKLPLRVRDLRWDHLCLLTYAVLSFLLVRWINPGSPWWHALLILAGFTWVAALAHLVVGRILEHQGTPFRGVAWVHLSLGGLALALTLGLVGATPYFFKRMDRSVAFLGRFGVSVPLEIRNPEAAAKQAYQEGLRLLKQKGKERQAMRAFTKAVNLSDDNYRARYRLAWLYYRRGDLYYAGVEFQYVINEAPNSPEGVEARKMLPKIQQMRQQQQQQIRR